MVLAPIRWRSGRWRVQSVVRFIEQVTTRLAETRRSQGITQEQLADQLDIPVQHVKRVEAGQNVTLETLVRFAIALGVSVEVVFEANPDGPRKPPPSRRQRTKARRTE